MPQMGESVMEGTVIEWAKSVGDRVEEDETLLEIATDKVDTEIPSPQSGVLVEILAEEGDTVEVGQAIAVIETDADQADVQSGDGQAVSEEAEETDETGETEAEQEKEPEEATAGKTESQEDEQQKAEEKEEIDEEEPAAAESKTVSGGGEKFEVKMPKMGESVMEGTVIEWAKSVGDEVEEDETLLEISTDKVDTEVPAPVSGVLSEILVDEGDTVEVDQTIAIIEMGASAGEMAAEEPAGEKKKDESTTEKAEAEEKETEKETEPEPAHAAATTNGAPTEKATEPQRIGSDGRFYSPLVRSIAKEEGISQEELESIEGSGKGGRVSKDDVLNYLEEREQEPEKVPAEAREKEEKKAEPEKPEAKVEARKSISAGELDVQRPSDNVEIIKMDRMRKMIAEHMIRSKKTSAHVTTFAEADVTNLVKWREANKKEFQKRTGVKLTYTPLFLEAIIQAIREFPLINSSLNLEDEEIVLKRDINFGIAVALGEGGKGGLIVPVIKKAQEKNLEGLANEVNELAEKARTKNLNPDDLVGGTITLTNYGSVGNLMGTPIINQPQVAIFGTGVIEKKPVVMETEQGDVIAIRHMMYLSLSYDHRLIDGAHGGAFLNRVKELLEEFDTDRSI